MTEPQEPTPLIQRLRRPMARAISGAVLGAVALWGTVAAGDILRRNVPATPSASAATAAGSSTTTTTTTTGLTTSQDRLARTTKALADVRKMQEAARQTAISETTDKVKAAVPMFSWNTTNGLKPATNVLNGLDTSLWTGAKLPTAVTKTQTDGTTKQEVTIAQTQQQAVLNWQSFNVGKDTILNFDQSAGGTDVGQWIVFNKVGVTGSPSQILGSINAQGQVYVINPNGIIFGGSSQVNTHALVASSLPINDNLISRGLLNNPDAQFLFSGLAQDAGKNGTPAFTPVVMDEYELTDATSVHTLALNPSSQTSPTVSYVSAGLAAATLKAGVDYALSKTGTDGKTTISFTATGQAKAAGATVQVSYTPTADQFGDVVVQAGAKLTAPTNADHVGGRVALIGRNVSNAGTISTADGQAILAAGLQVSFTQHKSADPTLRGLDVFVGAVEDPELNVSTAAADGSVTVTNTGLAAGTVTNDRIVNADGTVYTGLITAPRGAITVTGRTVNQHGFIDSSTSVSYNGRVDLVAGYNAVANPKYDASLDSKADFTLALPFFYQSNTGNLATGAAVANSGSVTLGKNSVLQILPETASTDRVAGDLALLSQVNIQGRSVYFGADATVLAPGAAVPLAKAYASDGSALDAGVSIRAGQWYNPADTRYRFVQVDDTQQIYLDKGAAVDVAGLSNVSASVTENIISVELRGTELADSPLQRDGALRGQTIQVDIRQHGAWDSTLNGGLGGYTWVGTPLANTAGWVGLTTHTVAELSVNGGSVSFKAGGPVVLQTGSAVDVSGGSIDYAAGYTRTTKVSANGHVYDIAQATPDRVYDGIYSGTTTTTDPKWGVTQSSTSPLAQTTYQSAYSQGGNGGSLAISASVVALDGAMQGNTVAGPGQRTLSPVYNPASVPDPANPKAAGVANWLLSAVNRPVESQLALTIGRQYLAASGDLVNYSPTPANIVFRTGSTLSSADAYDATAAYLFPEKRNYELDLDPSLFAASGSGFGIVSIDNSNDNVGDSAGFGNITVKAGTNLTLTPAGSLTLSAGNIRVESGTSVTANGGLISLNAYDVSSSLAQSINYRLQNPDPLDPGLVATEYDPLRGNVAIATGATLSTAGSVIDDQVTSPTSGTLPLVTGGGTIAIKGNDIALQAGSRLTVSGGGLISNGGKLSYGAAGNITLTAGKALAQAADFGAVLGGRLNLTGVSLEGYAGLGKKGGSLDLQAPSVLVKALTGTATTATDATTGALTLAPEFFNAGGFSSFTATGLGFSVGADKMPVAPTAAFTVATNTIVQPAVLNWATSPGGSVFLAQEGMRKAASLNFKTAGAFEDVNKNLLGNSIGLVVSAGAVLATDPGGSISLGGGAVDVLGRVTARGGVIALTQSKGGTPFTPGIHLGSASVLDTSGTAVFTQDITGYHKSEVLDGGRITLTGNLVLEKGSSLNVSGATDSIELPAGQIAGTVATGTAAVLQSVVKDSNGGTISLKADQLLLTAASLTGTAGGTTGQGGALNVSSTRSNTLDYADSSGQFQPTDPALILSAATTGFVFNGLGSSVTDSTGVALGDAKGLGLVRFGADTIGKGFGSLAFTVGRGAVQVEGNVALTATKQVTVADGGVLSLVSDPKASATATHTFSVTAPYVALGQAFLGPQPASSATNPFGQNVTATNGTGVLSVKAGTLIDVGNLSLQNTGTVLLDATAGGTTAGAIRGDGTLDVAGAVTLKAAQIYPPTGVTFNVIAEDYTANAVVVPGSVTIQPAAATTATPSLPLSAGGALNIYASTITQGGVLRAPVGTISLGARANDTTTNPLSGLSLPATASLTLQSGSITSVSALDPVTGKAVTIPYGITVNGGTWIDPTGLDITTLGPDAKAVTLTAGNLDLEAATSAAAAAAVDLGGGGDLFAYQFVPGAGGSTDLLLGSTAGGFAIIPGYQEAYAPFAPYATTTDAQASLGNDTGYVIGNTKLNYRVGDRIHLEAGGGLPAGDYTLLPARYALLPGAYLVTPRTAAVTAGAAPAVVQPSGATVVAGYRYSGLDLAGRTQKIFSSFEVSPRSLVVKRAQYDTSSANAFFTSVATSNGTITPRLPVDAGQLVLSAGATLQLEGTIKAAAATGGRGGLIDISSTADIIIGSKSVIADLGASSGNILLDATKLSSYGAASLLVGGTRTTDDTGTTVTVTNNNVTVDNAGAPLTGSDVILVANKGLTLANGAEVGKVGEATVTADPLRVTGLTTLNKIGDSITFTKGGQPFALPSGTVGAAQLTATSSGTITTSTGTTTTFLATTSATGLANAFTVPAGATITLDTGGVLTLASSADKVVKPIPVALADGTLLRVGSDPTATTVRTGIASSTAPVFTLGTGVKLAGGSVTIDSTNTTTLADTVDFSAIRSLTLNSGRISVLLDQPGTVGSTGSLTLSRAAQQSLLKSVTSLSLLSYTTLDFYGTGAFGASTLGSLGLHAGTIRGFLNSTDPLAGVTVAAKAVKLDNAANAAVAVAAATPTGTLAIDTGTLQLGGNNLEIQNFAAVNVKATTGVLTGDVAKLVATSGGFNVNGGALSITTPLVAGATGTTQSISADGRLTLSAGTGTATVTPGLAASLSLTGSAVDLSGAIRLPSGSLSVLAKTGDVTITGASLDVGGTPQYFYDVTKYTDGGQILLSAAAGNLVIAAGSKVSVSADAAGGSAGSLALATPAGKFTIAADTLFGNAGAGGQGGAFSLDTVGIPGSDPAASHLATLSAALTAGGFNRSVDLRVRQGDVIVDGTIRAHDYALAADHGSITVSGSIDASGLIGASRTDPLGGTMNEANSTGGSIDLAASGSVVLAPGSWLTAAGYAYNNAGKGGTISLSAGNYTTVGGSGSVNTAGVVEVQTGAQLDLGVKHAFTPNDLLLNPGVTAPVSTRTDFAAGTLHVRESQIAFGSGAQFANLTGLVNGASGIVLEGFQVFDLTGSGGTVSTAGAITSSGSGGLIDRAVENAIKASGAAFAAAASPALLSNALFHVQPGAEIVNTTTPSTTVTRNFVTLTSSATASRSLVNFTLKPGSGVFTTALIPGGLPVGLTLKTTTGRQFTVTTADGVTSSLITATSSTTISSTSASNPVVAVNFKNTGITALATALSFNTGTTPLTVAFDPAIAISSTSNAGRYASTAGDLVLANTWDLSTYRFGARFEPGNLTLRGKGNLVFGFDASLSDGFDPANAADATNPLWTATLMSGTSWSYHLVAGADYTAANAGSVQPLSTLATGTGSLLLGEGGLPLPTTTTGATRASIIPRYYQTIRTGTGDIAISAGRDVQLLNPLATVYTAGTKAATLVGFDMPVLDSDVDQTNAQKPYSAAQYSLSGGDVTIRAQNDIARYVLSGTSTAPGTKLIDASSKELPDNWLYRRGNVGADGRFLSYADSEDTPSKEIQSTSWWVDFTNFFSDIATLGGGDVSLIAGHNVTNVNAAAATNARMPGKDLVTGLAIAPDASKLVELGGGNVSVKVGGNIDGGVYYVERGDATLRAGGAVTTNATRAAFTAGANVDPIRWLPTTFFLGKGRVEVAAAGDVRIGSVANPFWLPQGAGNRLYETSYFTTFNPNDEVNVSSLRGTITLQVSPNDNTAASLTAWYSSTMSGLSTATAASQPWLLLGPAKQGVTGFTPVTDFQTVAGVLPAALAVTAFAGDIDLVGRLTLAPSPIGSLDLLAASDINGLRVNGIASGILDWGSATVTVSDADPTRLPGIATPISNATYVKTLPSGTKILAQVDALFAESGRTNLSLEEKLALHGQTTDATGALVPLHYSDSDPVRVYAGDGDISGLTLYSPKSAKIVASADITDVAFYVQNQLAGDTTVVVAGRDLIAYDPSSPLRLAAQQPGNSLVTLAGSTGPASGTPTAGDIQIAGPGALEVLAGRNLDLGSGSNATKDGTAAGILSVGATRNPYLPQNSGAAIIAMAGTGSVYSPAATAAGLAPGLATTSLNFSAFVSKFLDPASADSEAARYLPELAKLMGLTSTDTAAIWAAFGFNRDQPLTERQAALVVNVFNLVLRNAARDRNNPDSPNFGKYTDGFAAIAALFPGSPQPTEEDLKSTEPVVRPAGPWNGNLSLSTREIKTFEGGGITLLTPGGNLTVGRPTDPQKADQGVLTERGGGISIFAADDVNVGTSRIFTLRGGNEILWSTWGNIAAGSGSKTVYSAPPTRVLVDPQSGDVQNDLAGLATGSGIGVLATLSGVKPGDVDLIAPVGTIDAGDAGIRSSGNLNLAARVILNSTNIQVGGASAGTPPPPAAPNLGSLSAASTASAGASTAATDVAKQSSGPTQVAELPSLITVEVLGYGGDDDDDKEKAAAGAEPPSP